MKLLIVDGNSIANRAFYALPFLSNHEGKPSGAVFGFANILIKVITEQKPTHVAVAFDHARKTFRNEIYADYKGQRKPTPPELISQFPVIKEMLNALKIKTFEFNNIEADDIIGTICNNCPCEKFILSGDRDLLQLIDRTTTVWLTKKGVTEVDKVDAVRLKELYNLAPWQIIEVKGLMGDSSDNIPGVKGVGEKTAHDLLDKYQSIDGIYKNIDLITGKLKEKLLDGKADAYMSKTLATIKTDCDFEFNFDDCALCFPFSADALEFFKSYDFTSLTRNEKFYSISPVANIPAATREELNEKGLNEILTSNCKSFAYDLKKMTFATSKNKVYFLNGNYDMFGSSLSIAQVIKALKPIFENSDILKLTPSAKEDMHILDKFGVTLENYFDLSLSRYVINAGLKVTETSQEANSFFDEYASALETFKREGLEEVYFNIELPLVKILKEMEDSGFKLNSQLLDELDQDYIQRLDQLSRKIYEQAGEEFNINSPKQVAHILFEKLGIEAWNNKKNSTRVAVLDELRHIPIVDDILKHRKLAKLKNTYIDVYKKLCSGGDSIIHTTFNQSLTSTGRLSSSEPNLQTIPTRDEEGRELRKIFISKFNGGGLYSADYNQIELRLMADMSGEGHLIDAYNQGKDIHRITASQIFGKREEDVTQNERREAKAVNFGIIYGISDYGLSQNIKSSRAKAKEYIDNYFNRYPLVKTFMENSVKEARDKGYIRTKFGRLRRIPEINSSKYLTRTFGERVAMNMPLQGTASDIIKLAMINVFNALKPFKSQLILQIHDELIIDTYPGEEEKVAQILRKEMENVVKLKVPLIASVSFGKNLYDCK